MKNHAIARPLALLGFALVAACGAEADAEDTAAPENGQLSEAEQLLVDTVIDDDEHLVSIDLDESGNGEYAGVLRYIHPVGGDVTADCSLTLDHDPDGTPFAQNYRCDVRQGE